MRIVLLLSDQRTLLFSVHASVALPSNKEGVLEIQSFARACVQHFLRNEMIAAEKVGAVMIFMRQSIKISPSAPKR